jgi:hypothetical protein
MVCSATIIVAHHAAVNGRTYGRANAMMIVPNVGLVIYRRMIVTMRMNDELSVPVSDDRARQPCPMGRTKKGFSFTFAGSARHVSRPPSRKTGGEDSPGTTGFFIRGSRSQNARFLLAGTTVLFRTRSFGTSTKRPTISSVGDGETAC